MGKIIKDNMKKKEYIIPMLLKHKHVVHNQFICGSAEPQHTMSIGDPNSTNAPTAVDGAIYGDSKYIRFIGDTSEEE